jgi:hypothetical protein
LTRQCIYCPPVASPIPLPATLMKIKLIFILILISIKLFGQCGRVYPSGFYHNSQFVTTKGDTVNKLDTSGLYDGLHFYTNNAFHIFDESTSYLMGNFKHGIPIGDWTDHCNDGTYSVGQFSCGGGESSVDGKGGWITKKQGIYEKIGVWKFYDKNGILIETQQYIRETLKNGWVHKTYHMNSLGNFILVEFDSTLRYLSVFRKDIKEEYSDNGVLISSEFQNFWNDVSFKYYPNGQIKEKFKRGKFIGIEINHYSDKFYSQDGKLTDKKKGKYWTLIRDPAF